MNLVILDGYTLNPGNLSWEKLEAFGNLTVYPRTKKDEVIERAKDADIIFTNKTVIEGWMLEQLPKLKYIGVFATGYNVVDIEAARKHGIAVTNVPGYSTASVAQHVFALLLEISSSVGLHHQRVQEGKWEESTDFCFFEKPLFELANKTFGIVGYGQIGRQTAKIAKAFGCTVIAYDRGRKSHDEIVTKVDLDELFAQSDIISLHVPLFEDTSKMIDATAISKMKDNVILINTSRGGLIDEPALVEALLNGKVAAAGLDVLTVEPPKPHHPLLHLDNCIVTPHIAWGPMEAKLRLLDIAAENVQAFLHGQSLHRVD